MMQPCTRNLRHFCPSLILLSRTIFTNRMRTFTPANTQGTLHIPATAVPGCRGRIKTNILSWCGECINLLRCWAVNLARACIQRAVSFVKFVNFVKTVFASWWPAARAAACYVNDMSIIRICIKIGSRGERRLAGAHCARRGAEYLHSFQFDPTSNMLKLPPPHQLSAFLPTFSSRLLQQKSAFFLSLTDRSCPFSSRWKAGGGGHLVKSSETKLLRHLHARAQLSLNPASKENIFWVSLSPRTDMESQV